MPAPKYVLDTKAARMVEAWVILAPVTHKLVAIVRAYHSDSGNMSVVNVHNTNEDKDTQEHRFQYSKAIGYGYDKVKACLDGLVVDGITLKESSGLEGLQEFGYTVIRAL